MGFRVALFISYQITTHKLMTNAKCSLIHCVRTIRTDALEKTLANIKKDVKV